MPALRVIAVHIDAASQAVDVGGFFRAAAGVVRCSAVELEAIVVGRRPDVALGAQALHAGAQKVRLFANADLAMPAQAEEVLALLQDRLGHVRETGAPCIIVLHADSMGEEVAARLAVRLNGRALGACERLDVAEEGWIAHKSVLAGRMQATLALEPGVVSMVVHAASGERATATAGEAGETGTAGAVEQVALSDPLPRTMEVEWRPAGATRKRLENAPVIVCGGRGVNTEEGFALLQAFADALDAPLGGSLSAVDAGWVPVSHQIGQSGMFVAPRRYIAVGISGTPQHLAGLAPGTEIIAINKDPEADIFKVARVGVVAEWQALLPVLLEQLGEV